MRLPPSLAVGLVVMLYAPNSRVVAAQAANFGFRFSFGSCLTERLDTFTGMFSKELGDGRTATAHIVLTEAQMTAIHRGIEDIKFFDYPSPFNGVPTGVRPTTLIEPSVTYHLEVRNGAVVHTVEWKTPTVQRLPKRTVCWT
jgi:hypothetical protein